MNAAVGLMAGLGLDGDWCISVIPRQLPALFMPNVNLSMLFKFTDLTGKNLSTLVQLVLMHPGSFQVAPNFRNIRKCKTTHR